MCPHLLVRDGWDFVVVWYCTSQVILGYFRGGVPRSWGDCCMSKVTCTVGGTVTLAVCGLAGLGSSCYQLSMRVNNFHVFGLLAKSMIGDPNVLFVGR
jgi:hypothetical protein